MALANSRLGLPTAKTVLMALPLLLLASPSDAKRLYEANVTTVGAPMDPVRAIFEILRLVEAHTDWCPSTVTDTQLEVKCPKYSQVITYSELNEIYVYRLPFVHREKPFLSVWSPRYHLFLDVADENEGRTLANAMYWLGQSNKQPGLNSDVAFHASVAAARLTGDRTEAQRRAQVQAEALIAQNRPTAAAMAYYGALTGSPDWPQGHYNLALVCGSLKLYSVAITEMRRYLYLDPKAADARAAQDQIYGWETMAGTPGGR